MKIPNEIRQAIDEGAKYRMAATMRYQLVYQWLKEIGVMNEEVSDLMMDTLGCGVFTERLIDFIEAVQA